MIHTALLLCLALAGANDPWHLPEWSHRAIVEIEKPSDDTEVDTAAVKVLTHGRCQADGRDLRVLDAAGQAVPFQVRFLDASRYTLILFRAAGAKAGNRFFVYFGNTQPARAAEQVDVDEKPGAGSPRGSWTPRAGLVLTTRQRPAGENPLTPDEFHTLWSASPAAHGARYQRKISDGFNPFGSSDFYLSAYRGWLKVPQAGTYQFCTVSNEASFSFLDGRELIHWPGRHTEERGIRGEKNVTVELTAGWHFVEYYHEEVTLRQMAFLGWRTPTSGPPFEPIPESAFVAPHTAAVTRCESKVGIVATFEPTIVDSLWPENRSTGQFTRAKFRVQCPKEPSGGTDCQSVLPGSTFRWEFGDGQSAAGAEVEHVYLVLGKYDVTLTATEPNGKSQAVKWPLDVFEIQHVTDDIGQGKPSEYAKLATTYDPEKFEATPLFELAHLFGDAERFADSVRIGRRWLARFASSRPKETSSVQRLIAVASLRGSPEGQADAIDAAIQAFEASLTDHDENPIADRLDSLAQVVRLLGIERGDAERAQASFAKVEEAVRGKKLDDDARSAYRRAIIAAGDVKLWRDDFPAAIILYRRAEFLDGKTIPVQIRAARLGAFPQAVRDYLETDQFEAALDLINQWDETFPTEKPKGHTLYWRGKTLHLRGQHRDAGRLLDRSIRLATGAAFESEARWLRCVSLVEVGQTDVARKELVQLTRLPLADRFTELAKERLKTLP